jgi:hypothetical protein
MPVSLPFLGFIHRQHRRADWVLTEVLSRSLSKESTGSSNFETNGIFQAPFEQDTCPRRAIWILLFRHFDYSDRLLVCRIPAANCETLAAISP